MNPDFTIQFRLDRKNNDLRILLTDTSSGFTNTTIAGNFKVTYPNGTVNQNTDVMNPDIAVIGNSVSYTLKLDANNKILTGSYTFQYTVVHSIDGTFVETKTFVFSWQEPELEITDSSDVVIPEVVFTDAVDYVVSDFSEAITRVFSSDFPSTSSAVGNPISTGTATLTMVYVSNTYEGIYDPELDVNVVYTGTAQTYLSVYYHDVFTKSIDIRKIPSRVELVGYINTFKENQEVYIGQSKDAYDREEEIYHKIIARYTHLFERIQVGLYDGSQNILTELLNLLNVNSTYVYQSGPITGDGAAYGAVTGVTDPNFIIVDPGTYIYKGTVDAIWTMPPLASYQNTEYRIKNASPNGKGLRVNADGTDKFYGNALSDFLFLFAGNPSRLLIAESNWTF